MYLKNTNVCDTNPFCPLFEENFAKIININSSNVLRERVNKFIDLIRTSSIQCIKVKKKTNKNVYTVFNTHFENLPQSIVCA